jgi:hypothetical protein
LRPQRCRPPQQCAATWRALDGETTADLFCTSTQIRQAAISDIVRHSAAVVDHFDAQVVVDDDLHGQGRGLGVTNGIADRFPHDRFGMIGQHGVDHRQRTDVLDGGVQSEAGELADRIV